MSAFELFHAFRNGWRDGAGSRPEDLKYTEHKTRPDLTEQYIRGYDQGRLAYRRAMNSEMDRTGYKPSVLRGEETDAAP